MNKHEESVSNKQIKQDTGLRADQSQWNNKNGQIQRSENYSGKGWYIIDASLLLHESL